MSALLLAVLLAAAPPGPVERQARLEALQTDLVKVDRSLEDTERLIAKSRAAKYLPDLELRLCELMVEKSRLVFHLQDAQRSPEERGALVSPETRLLKEKAVAMYARLLREFPGYAQADKARFYLAHEQRELGQFPQMLRTLGELVRLHPRSPLRLEAEQILGDHFFDAADLGEAERHYKKVLAGPESPVHDLARYKLGWVRVNQLDHAGAVDFFEAVARSRLPRGADGKKALNLKREALSDLVYSYTEVRPAKGALAYFERLADSRATYALVLEKLASRYTARAEPQHAIPALRALLALRPDPDADVERVGRLYDALKETKDKLLPRAADVRALARVAAFTRQSFSAAAEDKHKVLAGLEEMARDLSTRLHQAAQKKDDRRLYSEAADAYREYLAIFRPARHLPEVLGNRADALYAARRHVEAARAFEELAAVAGPQDGEAHARASYAALVAWQASVKTGELERRTLWESTEARQALKLLGASFGARYPKDAHAAEVAFNVARAHFDDGEFRRSAELFEVFASRNAEHKDAATAGHLALDSWRQVGDFARLEATGQRLLAAALPEGFKAEVQRVLADARGEAFSNLALASAEKEGGVVEGLLAVAAQSDDAATQARALQGALQAAREKKDLAKEQQLAERLLAEHPDAPETRAVSLALAHRSVEAARFGEAAGWYERAAKGLGANEARDAWLAAANLRLALGDTAEGIADLDAASRRASGKERAELQAQAAEEWLQSGAADKAVAAARRALGSDGSNVRAAAVLAEAAPAEWAELAEVLGGAEGEAAARGLWHLAEVRFAAFQALDADDVEAKVAALQELEATYAVVAQRGAPEWSVAALWRLAVAYQHLGEVVGKTDAPEELAAGDVLRFRAALAEQTAPLKARADQAFAACVERAEQFEVFTVAAAGCRARRADPEVAVASARADAKARAPEAMQSAVDQGADAAALLALGGAYLERRQPRRARLTLARAVELEPGNAAAHASLGAALFQLGEVGDAAAAFKEAARLDDGNAAAHGNLAALKCRYGDARGAREELDKVSDKTRLNGPEVDGGWRSCLDAISRR